MQITLQYKVEDGIVLRALPAKESAVVRWQGMHGSGRTAAPELINGFHECVQHPRLVGQSDDRDNKQEHGEGIVIHLSQLVENYNASGGIK